MLPALIKTFGLFQGTTPPPPPPVSAEPRSGGGKTRKRRATIGPESLPQKRDLTYLNYLAQDTLLNLEIARAIQQEQEFAILQAILRADDETILLI